MSQNSREQILRNIQQALQKPTEKPMPKPDFSASVYIPPVSPYLDVAFAENFKKNKSTFFFCQSIEEALLTLKRYLQEKAYEHVFVWEEYLQKLMDVAQLPYQKDEALLLQSEVSITLCEALAARTGSILVSSRQQAGRRLSIYPPAHIVVAFTSQIQPDLKEALTFVQEQYTPNFPSMLSVISGPSQTADIEKTLVLGAHGPKELTLFLIDES
ncbi:LutC/YkgG family protein [Eisenibacter elegans]|jgi:L-lactate dehydrogenase complex protein LldG|uniref:LutC/YkgG family protein n=1 Tax=Eisenibacter elegans TaxID=997 RepID=UPI000417CB64|nr:lactate utilization protein [Eisenibacter elegans]